MLGTEYYREPENNRIAYEIIKDPSRLSLVRIWRRNRPPDHLRVNEVCEHIRNTNVCDGQILLAIVNGECVCYDGSHRLDACRIYFPKGGVQVRILYDSTDREVSHEFMRINKSIPVPELYFSEDEVSMRLMKLVQEITKGIVENYSMYVSASRKPKRPNFNRDTFTEELLEILQENLSNERIINLTDTNVTEWLQKTNQVIRTNHFQQTPRIKAPTKILEKCEKHKFYLFVGDWKTVLKHFLE